MIIILLLEIHKQVMLHFYLHKRKYCNEQSQFTELVSYVLYLNVLKPGDDSVPEIFIETTATISSLFSMQCHSLAFSMQKDCQRLLVTASMLR